MNALACVPWRQRSVPSVKFSCTECGAKVAASKLIAPRVGVDLIPICMGCARREVASGASTGPLAEVAPEARQELRDRGYSDLEIDARSVTLRKELLGE